MLPVVFEEFEVVYNFLLFFHYNCQLLKSQLSGGWGCSPPQPPPPGFYGPVRNFNSSFFQHQYHRQVKMYAALFFVS